MAQDETVALEIEGQQVVAHPMSRPELLPVAERSKSFVEVQESIGPEVAIQEARRYLRYDYREEEVQE